MENISVTYTIDGSTKTKKSAYISEGEYTSFEISFLYKEMDANHMSEVEKKDVIAHIRKLLV